MKKIKVGAVGLGRLGRQHAINAASKIQNAELIAVCANSDQEVSEFQEEWHIPYGYTDYEELLENKELDAILISTPSGFHCEQIKKALEKGYHVFTEKPLGLYIDEVYQVKESVEEHPNQVFMVGFMRRYDPSYQYAKKKIEEGTIGEPILIRCYSLDPKNAIEGFIQFAKKNYSGGLYLDMGIHDLDLARWLLKAEGKEVWAVGDAYAYPELGKLKDADLGAAMMRFEGNKLGLFVAGRNCAHGYHIETEIIGTEGSLRIGTISEKNAVTIFNDSGALKECSEGFIDRFEEAYANEVQEFIDCILETRQPEVGVIDGVRATELGYACKESFETNGIVQVKK